MYFYTIYIAIDDDNFFLENMEKLGALEQKIKNYLFSHSA